MGDTIESLQAERDRLREEIERREQVHAQAYRRMWGEIKRADERAALADELADTLRDYHYHTIPACDPCALLARHAATKSANE